MPSSFHLLELPFLVFRRCFSDQKVKSLHERFNWIVYAFHEDSTETFDEQFSVTDREMKEHVPSCFVNLIQFDLSILPLSNLPLQIQSSNLAGV